MKSVLSVDGTAVVFIKHARPVGKVSQPVLLTVYGKRLIASLFELLKSPQRPDSSPSFARQPYSPGRFTAFATRVAGKTLINCVCEKDMTHHRCSSRPRPEYPENIR